MDTFGRVHAGAAALALPAGAAVALLLARGGAVLDGPGAASFAVLAATGLAGLAVLGVVAVREARAPPELSRSTRVLVDAVCGGLGDAVLVLDGGGRVVQANAAAAQLVGIAAERIVGREAAFLGEDLPALLRGLSRGPAAALIALATPAGAVRARAALVRVSARPPVDLAVLRPEPAPARAEEPRPAPIEAPAPSAPRPPPGAEHDLALAAIGAALRDPLVRATTAASMLRLVLPAPPLAAERELARVEEELAVAERRLAALAAAGERGTRAARPLDLVATLAEIARTLRLPAGVRVHLPAEPARARVDDARVRPALREALRGIAATLPQGGEIAVRARRDGGDVVLELGAGGMDDRGAWVPFVRALLGPADGRVEEDAAPGRGTVCRLVFHAADASATAVEKAV